MGLSSKEPVIVVKEEVNNDVCKEIGIACSCHFYLFIYLFLVFYSCCLFMFMSFVILFAFWL